MKKHYSNQVLSKMYSYHELWNDSVLYFTVYIFMKYKPLNRRCILFYLINSIIL